MNFHISNLSPLRPQFSTPSTRRQHHDAGPVKIEVEPADPDDTTADGQDDDDDDDTDALSDVSADDVTQDSRDVLVQRLTDLAERLSGADVRTGSIETLHRHVDDMERVLRGDSRSRSTSRQSSRRVSGRSVSRPKSLQLPPAAKGPGEAPRGRESLGVMAPMSPSWFMSHFQRSPSAQKETEVPRETDERVPRQHSNSDSMIQQQPPVVAGPAAAAAPAPNISSEVAEDVVKEAEKLCAEMATVIESLQTRREESDHIHTILVQREEVANKRVHEATVAVHELEDVVADNEAELRHLRLELRAIEVQCLGYVPKGADPELAQSIRNWKDDWQELREKWSSRHGSSLISEDESSTLSTLASPTSSR